MQNVLSDHDIMPGGSYSVDEIEAAIEESLGGDAYLHCQGSQNTLVEVSLEAYRMRSPDSATKIKMVIYYTCKPYGLEAPLGHTK